MSMVSRLTSTVSMAKNVFCAVIICGYPIPKYGKKTHKYQQLQIFLYVFVKSPCPDTVSTLVLPAIIKLRSWHTNIGVWKGKERKANSGQLTIRGKCDFAEQSLWEKACIDT